MLYNTFGNRTTHKPKMSWGIDELNSSIKLERGTEGGILFARSIDGDEKAAARQLILDLFHPDRWQARLRIVTMPGVMWRFERKLFDMREPGWFCMDRPQITQIMSVENNRSIFSASVAKMPGLDTPFSIVKETGHKPFSEIGIMTRYVRHYFCNVDDFISYKWDGGFDAAWLDYTGPLSIDRMRLIQRFYDQHLKPGILIITSLMARWNKDTVAAIRGAGGHSAWLRQYLDGYVLHDIRYYDTSPMGQFAIAHW